MTTEEMLEDLIQMSVKAYKKNSKGCSEWNKLNYHETVIIDGIPFNYWREYAVYKVSEWLNDKGIETEPIRFDEYTQKRMTFFRDPDDLPLELHE